VKHDRLLEVVNRSACPGVEQGEARLAQPGIGDEEEVMVPSAVTQEAPSMGATSPLSGEAGFDVAFDDLYPRAVRLARRMVGSQDAAEDIAAEALARAFARWANLASLEYRDAWVMRVVINLAHDAVRARSRRYRYPLRVQASETAEDDVTVLRLSLAAAVASLPARQRQAVTLRYIAGLSELEVSAALGISGGAVKTHLHRGIAALRRTLGPNLEEMCLACDE
jgi:RNA polymerase sigma factor (sigma-70 family)